MVIRRNSSLSRRFGSSESKQTIGPVVYQQNRLESQEPDNQKRKKSVRFDESSNEEFRVKKYEEKDKTVLWYNSIDFDRFTDRVARRVEYLCTTDRKRKALLALEEVHFACRDQSRSEQGGEAELSGGVCCRDKKEMLVQSYHDNDELCGLEPYVAEFMPQWKDRFDQHKDMLREVLKKERRQQRSPPLFKRRKGKREALDQRSRRISLGSRLFAQEIAEATAASIAKSRK